MRIQADPLDPLYVIFEEHLYHFQDSEQDRKTFISKVVNDYLRYLRKMSILVPKSLEAPIVEELGTQVETMLVKKIYGCLTISDYSQKQPSQVKRRARARYRKLQPASKSLKKSA